jgi:hypothetical protein
MRLIDTIPGTMTISAAMDAGEGGVGAGSLGAGAERRLLHIAQAPVQVQGPNGHTWRYIVPAVNRHALYIWGSFT